MAALSFRVHSATTLALISFMYSMKAFSGFLMWGFLSSSFLGGTGDFLLRERLGGGGGERGSGGGREVSGEDGSGAHACMLGLMLSPLGSCLMAGETMAGCGIPVWWRLCGGGVTMWGEKRLETKLGWEGRKDRQFTSGSTTVGKGKKS